MLRRNQSDQVAAAIDRFQPDWVSVHNLHGSEMQPVDAVAWSRRAPVLWTLHDMWAFTGGCAYSRDCRLFETGCSTACPRAQDPPAFDRMLAPDAWSDRFKAYRHADRLAFVTPSQWLAREAQRGPIRGRTVHAIANSLDLGVYRPLHRGMARAALGLPQDRPLLLSPGLSRHDDRKGAGILLDAMQRTLAEPVTWVRLGGDELPGRSDFDPDRVHTERLAPMRDDRLLSLVYNAADLFILPTLADNLPNTLLEAAACGTPAVVSNVGGVPEAVDVGRAGWLAEPGDPVSLHRAIDDALHALGSEAAKQATRHAARAFAEQRFDPRRQAEAYLALADQLRHRPAGHAADTPTAAALTPSRRDRSAA